MTDLTKYQTFAQAEAEFVARERELTLTPAENAKLRAILEHVCGEEYVARIEAEARAVAREATFSEWGYENRRAIAPILIDLLFARDPDFVT